MGARRAHPPSPGSRPVPQFTASVTSAALGAHSQVRGVRRAKYLGHRCAHQRAVAAPDSQSSSKAGSLLRTHLSTPPVGFACFPVHSCRNSCLHFKCSLSTSMHFHVLNRQFPKPNHPFRIACRCPTVSVGSSPLPRIEIQSSKVNGASQGQGRVRCPKDHRRAHWSDPDNRLSVAELLSVAALSRNLVKILTPFKAISA